MRRSTTLTLRTATSSSYGEGKALISRARFARQLNHAGPGRVPPQVLERMDTTVKAAPKPPARPPPPAPPPKRRRSDPPAPPAQVEGPSPTSASSLAAPEGPPPPTESPLAGESSGQEEEAARPGPARVEEPSSNLLSKGTLEWR